MITLVDYLDKAPGALLQKFYRQLPQSGGLVSNTTVRNKVLDWVRSPERMQQFFENWPSEELLWLRLFYLHGQKGWNPERMSRYLNQGERYRITPWLDKIAWNLLGARVRGQQLRWLPFSEFTQSLFENSLSGFSLAQSEHFHWHDNSQLLGLHRARVMAHAALSKIRLVQSGEWHQKSRKSMLESFISREIFGENAADQELDLILEMLCQEKVLNHHQGSLLLGSVTLKQLSWSEQQAYYLRHWLNLRGYDLNWLKSLLGAFKGNYYSRDLLTFWGVESQFNQDPLWEQLPQILREMWLLGLLRCTIENGRSGVWSIGSLGQQVLYGIQAPAALGHFCTPNFEVHLTLERITELHFALELTAHFEKEGAVLKYVLKRDNLIQASGSNLNPEIWSLVSKQLPLPINVDQALKEWIKSITTANSAHSIWIGISDNDIRNKILSQNEFRELCLGIDPERGCAISTNQLGKLKQWLEAFGLILREENREITQGIYWHFSKSREPHQSESFEYDYSHHEPKEAVELQLSEQFVFGKHTRELDFSQRLRVLEYAILNDQAVELMDTNGKVTGVFQPVRILKQNTPIRVSGYPQDSEDLSELEIASIPSLRLM